MYIYLVMAWQTHSRINCILILFYVCFAEAKNVIQAEEHQLAESLSFSQPKAKAKLHCRVDLGCLQVGKEQEGK